MNFERNVIEAGGSLAVIIPADLAKYFDLKKGEVMIISDDEDKIVIRKKEV